MTNERSATRDDALPTEAPNVHNGTYTVSHADKGHFTVKLYTAQNGDLRGRRILATLRGPDNEIDYEGVAFWDDARRRCDVWRRKRGAGSRMPVDGYHVQRDGGWSKTEHKLAIWTDLVVRGERGFSVGEGYQLLVEGRCVRCNRKLTHPDSIRSGIGPECGGGTF